MSETVLISPETLSTEEDTVVLVASDLAGHHKPDKWWLKFVTRDPKRGTQNTVLFSWANGTAALEYPLSRGQSNPQSYFWTKEWQEGEEEADREIRAGKTRRFSNADEAIAWLRREQAPKEGVNIWEGYEPEKVREAIAATAGTWADLDTQALIAEVYRAREEGSRPATRP